MPQTSLSRQELQHKIAQESLFRSLVTDRMHKQIDAPKGHLVRQYDPVSGVVVGAIDMGKDIVNIGKSFVNGKSDDHSLGRMNDIGLKLGALTIGAFLAQKAPTKTGKMFEFIGPAAFIASMSLWPKLFIDLPIQLKHGFNPRQKFIDSQGRKKEFFQDNQYQPWDLYSPEQINKIGDRMNVPKNMPDREEFIKKKMRTIALQGNTLWMLTAGFATPLATALTCNAIKPKIQDWVIQKELKKAGEVLKNDMNGLLTQVKGAISSKSDSTNINNLKEFIEQHKEAINVPQINPKAAAAADKTLYEQIVQIIDPTQLYKKALSHDPDDKKIMNGISGLQNALRDDVVALRGSVSSAKQGEATILEGLKGIITGFTGVKADSLGGFNTVGELLEELEIQKGTPEAIIDKIVKLGGLGSDKDKAAQVRNAVNSLYSTDSADKAFYDEIQKLYAGPISDLRTKLANLTNATNVLVGEKTESIYTRAYQQVAHKLRDQLSLSKGQIRAFKNADNAGAVNILSDAMAQMAKKDVKAYGGFINAFEENFNMNNEITQSIRNALKGVNDSLNSADLTDKFKGLKNYLGDSGALTSSIEKALQKGPLNLDSTIARIITAVDFERRATGMDAGLLADCRRIIYSSTMADFQNKFQMQDPNRYKECMRVLFGENMCQATIDALGSTSEKGLLNLKALNDYRREVMNVADNEALNAIHARIDGACAAKSPAMNFGRIGEPIVNLFKKAVEQAGEQKTWLKMAGIAAGVLVVGTLLVQNFFGKVQDQDYYLGKKQKGAKDAN